MAENDRAVLLARLDEAWAALWRRVQVLDDAALRHVAPDSAWPVSVVLSHVGRWEDWHHDAIRDHLADGSVRPYVGFDGWNEAWAKEDLALAPSETLARLVDGHERFRSLLGGLQPEQWNETISKWVQGCTFEHYEEHISSFPPA